MGMFSKFLLSQNWVYLLPMLLGIVPCMVISTVFSRGCSKKAYQLGDSTPMLNGHGGFNPMVHLDITGLIFMCTAGIGWAKALPLAPDNFQKPRRDIFLVLWAGTSRCLLLAFGLLGVAGILLQTTEHGVLVSWLVWFCLDTVVLSCGFVLSQWFPLPCFALYQLVYVHFDEKKKKLVDKIQIPFLGMLVVLLWAGYLPLVFAKIVGAMIEPFCIFVPFSMVEYYFL